MKQSISLFTFIICLILGITACNNTKKEMKDKDATERITNITTSIAPLTALVKDLAGENVTVNTFVPKGASPETYEPTPKQLIDLNNSNIYFAIGGLGFEQAWLDKLKKNAPNTSFYMLDSAYMTSSCNKRSIEHKGHEHSHAHGDPHIWTSPQRLYSMATRITQTLCETNPTRKEKYKQQLDAVLQEINSIDDSIRHLVQRAPSKTFLIYHPSLTFFAQEYGLNQLSIEDEGKEPSAQHIIHIIAQAKAEKAKIIFVQKEFSTNSAEIIAKDAGLRVVEINPLSENWKHELIHIAQAIAKQ